MSSLLISLRLMLDPRNAGIRRITSHSLFTKNVLKIQHSTFFPPFKKLVRWQYSLAGYDYRMQIFLFFFSKENFSNFPSRMGLVLAMEYRTCLDHWPDWILTLIQFLASILQHANLPLASNTLSHFSSFSLVECRLHYFQSCIGTRYPYFRSVWFIFSYNRRAL